MNDYVNLFLKMIISAPIFFAVLALVLFVPANDFTWLEGWIFIFIFLLYIIVYLCFFLIKDPDLIFKRAKYFTDNPETKSFPDKRILFSLTLLFILVFLFPSIDRRFNLSQLPQYIEMFGFIGIIVALLGITYVNMVNRYASKGLVIHKDHELITSGPYKYVRHPMYSCTILMFICIPLALGSLIATIIAFISPVILIFRINIEEKMLVNYLNGYKEYMDRVKFKLFPRIY